MDTSPTLVTPTLGVATATSVNKVAITAPTTSATLTIADGKTLTANNSIVLAGTDATTMTFPSTNATIARTDAAQTFTGTQTFSGNLAVTSSTASTTTGTGALTVSGGAGIAGALNVGGNTKITGTIEIDGGSPGAGKVLTSDANGLASWNSNPNTALTTIVAATYTVVSADKYVIYSNAAAGTITLPDATSSGVGKGKEFIIKNISAYAVTLNTTSTQKIVVDSANSAATSATLGVEASNNWIRVISDGTQWIAFRALF
jgi:hypothetical protein